MSGLNGHLPDGARVITLAQLEAANMKYVRAPALSARLGQEVYVRIRAIRRAAYLQMLPLSPPGSEAWPQANDKMTAEERQKVAEERTKLFSDWLTSLPDDERAKRQKAMDDVTYKLLVAGMVEPRVTPESALDWADDADVIAGEILRFSGLLDDAKPAEVPPAETPATS